MSLVRLMSIETVMPSNHLILCHPLLLPPSSCSVVSNSLRPHELYSPPSSSVPEDSLGFSNTGVGCHSFLQGIFLTSGLNPGLLHCRQILYCLSYQGSPRCVCVCVCYWLNHIQLFVTNVLSSPSNWLHNFLLINHNTETKKKITTLLIQLDLKSGGVITPKPFSTLKITHQRAKHKMF